MFWLMFFSIVNSGSSFFVIIFGCLILRVRVGVEEDKVESRKRD